MFEELEKDECFFLEPDEFRSMEFNDEEDIQMQKQIIETMNQYDLGGIEYSLILHIPSEKLYVFPEKRTIH